jgi:TolA-binding protein
VRERVVVVEKPAVTVEPPAEHVESRVEPVVETPTPPQPDPELAAYRVAYDAHFHGASPEAAVAAWDAYLAAYPDGKLATDARYNRAIMLVKLKRFGEAAEALRPLASTRDDAARLLNALPH